MNIVYGDAIKNIPDSYTVLELDTFRDSNGTKRTAYCVVENIPLQDFPVLDAYRQAHAMMMQAFRDQNWEYCQCAIKGLVGRWNGELDSFYDSLLSRVDHYSANGVDNDWDGTFRA